MDLEQLLQLQELRWKTNEPILVEQLVMESWGKTRLQEIEPATLLELICNEVFLREQRGEHPNLAEYQAKFPSLAEELSIQWEIDRLLSNHDTNNTQATSKIRVTPISHSRVDSSNDLQFKWIGFEERFQIRSELGRGSNGIVYEAWDSLLKRTLALKRLRSGIDASPDEIGRMRAEAEAIARIHSPNIVQVFDVGECDGFPFLAMEFCEGGSLAKRLNGNPLPPRIAAEMIAWIAKGIAAAHECRIIHRDLKPGNILLESTSSWIPKVADFGLAKLLDSDNAATATGTLLGTPAYMAPEQAFGGSKHAGPEADIYSIGAILYECLTGSPPFRGSTPAEILEQVRNQEPVSIRQLQTKTPADLETIALKCLQKDPHQRYRTASLLAEDLTRYLEGRPIVARRVGPLERLNRWSHRNPTIALLLGLTAFLLSVLAIGSTVAAVWLKHERDNAVEAKNQAIESERHRRQELYRAYILEARSSRLSQQAGHREFGLEAIRNILRSIPIVELNAEQRSELRDEAIASLVRVDTRRDSNAMPMFGTTVFGDVDVDSNLQWVSYVDGDERTVIAPLNRTSPILYQDENRLTRRKGSRRSISPDGRWLVETERWEQKSETEYSIRVWDFHSRRWVARLPIEFGLGEFVFDPNVARCFARGADDCIHVIDLLTGKEIDKSPPRMQELLGMAMSPDGKRLAIASGHNPTEILDIATWKTIEAFPGIQNAFSVAWDPLDRFVVFGCESGDLFRWEASTGATTKLGGDHDSAIRGLQIAMNGKYLAASFENDTFEVRNLIRDQIHFNSPGTFLRFAEDRNQYASQNNGQVFVSKIEDESAYTMVHEVVDGITFTPDGNWILTGGLRGLQVFSAYDLQFSATLETDQCGPVSFHPNGSELITFGIFSKLWRWPMAMDRDKKELRFGPPSPISVPETKGLSRYELPYHGRHAVWSMDGESIAIADYRNGKVLLWRTGQAVAPDSWNQVNSNRVVMSSNGKWIASSAAIYPNVKVWSADSGDERLNRDAARSMAFSHDSEYLVLSYGHQVELYKTSDWTKVRTFESNEPTATKGIVWAIALQSNGELMAYSDEPGKIRLVNYKTGEVIANISGAGSKVIRSLSFSPDGTKIAFGTDANELGLLDLPVLRAGLEKLQLPFEKIPSRIAPPARMECRIVVERGSDFSKPEQWSKDWLTMAGIEYFKRNTSDAVEAVTSGIDSLHPSARPSELANLYTKRGFYHCMNQSFVAAESDWQNAIRIDPDRVDATRYLARLYSLGSTECRKPTQALLLATTLSLAPDMEQEAMLLKGLAYYRLNRWKECCRCLSEVTESRHYSLAQLFLSVAFSQLGLDEEAKQAMDVFHREREKEESQMTPLERADFTRATEELLLPRPK